MERFAQFEVLRPLGVGGMAETALAVRRGPDDFEQRLCLKRILPAFSKDAEFVRAFQNEAKIAVRLVHPHICRIYDFGSHEGTFWMSMEFLEGGDLRTLLENLHALGQPLPIDVVLLLALDIASALHFAHELRIDGRRAEVVHRDISPSNVLIDSTGHFKLADFGIAKVSAGGEVTRTGVVKGKIPYMAPEHARGQKVDARADLWSFGVLLFEALAGERPFRGSHDVETLLNVTEGRRKKVIEAAPHTPVVLAEVIERLLEPDLDRRIRRAADVIEALASTPPPANARLRLHALIERVHDEQLATERRSAAEAATEFPEEASTSMSSEATWMAPSGAAVGVAPQPVSARPDAETRAAQPMLVAMDTALLPADALPKATLAEHEPSTAVRRAAAEALAERAWSPAAANAGPSAPVQRAPAVPAVRREAVSATRRSAQAIIVFALIGVVGVGLGTAVVLFHRGPAEDATSSSRTLAFASGSPAPSAVPLAAAPPASAPPASAPPTGTADRSPAGASAPPAGPEADAPSEPAIPSAPTPSAPAPSMPAEEVPTSAAMTSGAADDEEEERGVLEMAAVPWGNIWLDGRPLGLGPITRRVAPGRHVVGAGPEDRALTTRTVTVRAGARERVLLRVVE